MRTEEDILRFITDKMEPAERADFAVRMESDNELKQAVEHSRRIRRITDQDVAAFSENVREVIASNRKNKKPPYMWIAASFSILVLTSVFYLLLTGSPGSDLLASDYLEPFPDIVTQRSEAHPEIDLQAYNQANYQEAINVLREQYNAEKDPLTALYLIVSLLYDDQAENALGVISEIDINTSLLKEDILWYKSLTLIKLNRSREAREVLKTLMETQSSYSTKSAQLLSDLD